MSDNPFPNVRTKLSAPTKKSLFEKQRLEAEEKRRREEAETAAVYKDFVASFDEDPSPAHTSRNNVPSHSGKPGFRGGAAAPVSGPGRRHFTTRGLGGIPGSGPPPSLRKRGLESAFDRDDEEVGGVFGNVGLSEREKKRIRDGNSGLLAFENSGPSGKGGKPKFADHGDDSDDESKPLPKPTVLLSSLPPTITKTAISDLLSSTPLQVDSIRIIPAPPPSGPSQPSTAVRKAATALVTLSSETPSSDIDSAVSLLNGRYIGSGFSLGIVRHLSSTVASNAPNLSNLTSSSHPFGAKAPRSAGPGGMGRGGPHRGGFAPPPNFAPPGSRPVQSNLPQVHVHPPQDLKMLKLIHSTIEHLIEHGPEFEALLMAKESVRSDPKFSFLWDARSQEGVYYRWKMWELVTGYSIDKPQVPVIEMFDNGGPGSMWVPPKKGLKYEWASSLREIVEDEGFMSDELDEEDSDREDDGDRPVGLSTIEGKGKRGHLGVLERAKLIHLITRIPTTTREVRRGDVGRVMAFAMEHAEGSMGEEIVDVLVSNVLQPLVFTAASKSPPSSPPRTPSPSRSPPPEPTDTSASKIIALWLISDILSNSSLGVRAAWRYRQLFDTALRTRNVFKHLGEIHRNSGWGRMKAEKFRRGIVEGVLEGWEKWCIFPQTTQEEFLRQFNGGGEKSVEKEQEEAKAEATKKKSSSSAWKTVDAAPSVFRPEVVAEEEDVDGVPMVEEDIDGEPMPEDEEDIDGVPMPEDEEDVDGVPMPDDPSPPSPEPPHPPEKEQKQPEKEEPKKPSFGLGFGGITGFKMGDAAGAKRKRPKAEDMFATSDGEEE